MARRRGLPASKGRLSPCMSMVVSLVGHLRTRAALGDGRRSSTRSGRVANPLTLARGEAPGGSSSDEEDERMADARGSRRLSPLARSFARPPRLRGDNHSEARPMTAR